MEKRVKVITKPVLYLLIKEKKLSKNNSRWLLKIIKIDFTQTLKIEKK